MSEHYHNWQLNVDGDGMAQLIIDKADAGTNVLSSMVLEELDQLIDDIVQHQPEGLIISSAKANGFIAGADITEFSQVHEKGNDCSVALKHIKFGQEIMNRLEALPCPSACLIDGFCMGGGLELALACDYRIATSRPETRFSLPEIKLGIHPGFGGTMRLNRLIGAVAAMDLMLTGRSIDARRAKKLGIIDHAVPMRHLQVAARQMLSQRPPPHRANLLKSMTSHSLVRTPVAARFRKVVAKQASPEHYPAPYSLIDLWQQNAGSDQEMLNAEAESVASLVTTETCKNLLRVFFLQEQLKSQKPEKSASRHVEPALKHIHVIGAGLMGGDIAAWCVVQGYKVSLQDREPQYIAPALQRAQKLFKRRFKQKHLLMNAQDRLEPDHKGANIEKADIVIEAIVENIEVKQELFRSIEPRLKADAVLATNTSSIELEVLGNCLKDPARLVGIHFFNPVAKMQLVEVVSTEETDPAMISRAATFVRAIGRLPLPVKSSPGFLINRILMPYLLEAVELISEGNAPESIDRVATKFGMPMGPIELADTVGLDICQSVAKILGQKLGLSLPDKLTGMIASNRLGKKTGEGFYRYDNKGKPIKANESESEASVPHIQDRLILRLLNECIACLDEGVIQNNDQLDAGMVFGTGFAPFLGGPMNYLQKEGKGEMLRRLQDLHEKYGDRFKPHRGWQTLISEDSNND